LLADAADLGGQICQSGTGKHQNDKSPIGGVGLPPESEDDNHPGKGSKAKSPATPNSFSFRHAPASVIRLGPPLGHPIESSTSFPRFESYRYHCCPVDGGYDFSIALQDKGF
jgi:hypothetical protein